MRGISFGRCEGRPKRTHNPEGNCQRCLDPFHDPRPAPTQALTSVRLHQGKLLQASLQTVSLTSVLTSNRTEHGRLRHKKRADLMRAISFRWCEGRPKRTHNPEGNCQAVSRPLPRPPTLKSLTSVQSTGWVSSEDRRQK